VAGLLALSDAQKAEIIDRVTHLPRPKHLAGKVSVTIELNCRPDGTVGDIYIDTSIRESVR